MESDGGFDIYKPKNKKNLCYGFWSVVVDWSAANLNSAKWILAMCQDSGPPKLGFSSPLGTCPSPFDTVPSGNWACVQTGLKYHKLALAETQ
ncbi:uncharacterized protein VP01_3618g2 [Puccinia sorghi]|uniref:Uncharacterized protein n=1 Tax=Puccinia sorghi TaxID=27349 RepID=A0A0L6UUW7_9BASI|nr:uncharacterized protein VP01_3618g2 [Puccinia sorghi]